MIFTQIREDVKNLIEADPWFSNVPVILQDKGEVNTEVDIALKKLGICIVIEQPGGKINYQGPLADIPLETKITINETVLINRSPTGTRKQAGEVLERLIVKFNPFTEPGRILKLLRFDLINDMGGSLIYQLSGEANAGIQETTDNNA